MSSFNELKNKVTKLFDGAEVFSKQAGYENISKNILKIKNEFLAKELMVVVCGEIKRGKSSLLTAFLEEKDIFPIDINTCTNVVTVVRYGAVEKIEAILEKQNKGEISYEHIAIKRSDIAQFVTEYGNESNAKRVNCLNIQIPNEKLKEGFVFVDTPGVGSLNFEHAQITYGFLPNADVLLFVSDLLNPLTDSELKFLEKAYGFCKNVIFPLTKSDQKNTDAINSTIDSNLEKITKASGLKREDVQILPVSNKMKLRYLETKKEEHLLSSNFKALEDLIWKTIYDNRTKILITPYLQMLTEELNRLKSNFHIQLEALAQDKETVNKLTSELQSKLSKKHLLLEGNAKWKADLQFELTNASITATEEITNESINISERVNALLSHEGAAERVESITTEINELLSNIVYNSKDNISAKVLEIVAAISSELGLSIDINEDAMNNVGFARKQSVEYSSVQKSAVDKVLDKGRQIGMNSMSGMAIGGVVGGLLGGLVGFFVGGPAGALALGSTVASWAAGAGAIGGTAKGSLDALKNSKSEDLPAIRIALNNYINRSINSIRNGVNLCIREMAKELTKELVTQINDQISQLDTISNQIKQNLALKQADIPKQTSKLNMQMSMAEGLEKSLGQITDEITR